MTGLVVGSPRSFIGDAEVGDPDRVQGGVAQTISICQQAASGVQIEDVSGIAGDQAAGFVVDAADFDAGAYVECGADLTGLSDGRQLTITGFLNTSTTNRFILAEQGGYVALEIVGSGAIRITVFSPGASSSFDATTAGTFADGTWHSIAASLDMNFGVGAKVAQIYVDRAAQSLSKTDFNAAFDIELTNGNWFVGSNANNGNFVGSLAEITLSAQFVDFSVGANLDKFFTAANKPADLGADGSTAYGAAAEIYLHLDHGESPANFAINAGSGGGMSVNPGTGGGTGTLNAAASSPSGSVAQIGACTIKIPVQAAVGSAALTISGAVVQAITHAGQAATGTERFTGSVAQAITHAGQAATGKERFTGSVAQAITHAGQAATGKERFAGSVAQAITHAGQAATGTERFTGSVAQAITHAGQAAAAIARFTGSVAQAITHAGQAAVAAELIAGVAASAAPLAQQAATAILRLIGTVAQQAPAIVQAVDAQYTPPSAIVRQTAPRPRSRARGHVRYWTVLAGSARPGGGQGGARRAPGTDGARRPAVPSDRRRNRWR